MRRQQDYECGLIPANACVTVRAWITCPVLPVATKIRRGPGKSDQGQVPVKTLDLHLLFETCLQVQQLHAQRSILSQFLERDSCDTLCAENLESCRCRVNSAAPQRQLDSRNRR